MRVMVSTFQDGVLGQLTYDDRLSRWDGASAVLGVPFSLSAHTFAESERGLPEDAVTLERYRMAFLRLERDESALRQQMAERMLPLAQEWQEDDGAVPMTAPQLLQQVTLESFSIYEDGDAELFYNDGDLFGGHVIIAVMNEDGTLGNTSIAG